MREKRELSSRKRGLFPKEKGSAIVMLVTSLVAIFFLIAIIIADSFPSDLILALTLIMCVMLLAIFLLLRGRSKTKRVIGTVMAFVFIAMFGACTYYMGSAYAMMMKVSNTTGKGTNYISGVDVVEEPFNVYITGIDQWEDEKGMDLERSDVNMLVSINPQTKKILLTSIPRDSYVKLHTAQQMDKLTHTGIYGVDETLNTVEDWLDLKLHYYVKLNFSGARDLIDAIGGIEINNPTKFKSSLKGYKYKKGIIRLNGKQALYYARERKAFEGKDSLRVENQQRVMKAILNTILSSNTILLHYGDVMRVTSGNLETNMSTSDIQALIKMQISDLSEWDIQSQKIEGEGDMDYVASLTQKQKFDIYRPDPESVKKCKDNIESIFNPSEAELEQAMRAREKSFFTNLVNQVSGKNQVEELDVDQNLIY